MGATLNLQDEAGVLLSRAKVPAGTVVSNIDCVVNLKFEKVAGTPRTYIVLDSLKAGWKLLPAEVIPGPAVIEFMKQQPEANVAG